MNNKKHYVIGLGEVGDPLRQNISEYLPCIGIDLDTPEPDAPCAIMHVCIGQKDESFVDTVVGYVEKYEPEMLIVNSTVIPGTCRKIAERVSCPVAHSPIRGKHVRMKEDQRHYDKFVGGVTEEAAEIAEKHFLEAGFRVRRMSSAETTEFAKISSTSYFGLHIAWAQEVERFCDQLDLNYDEVISIYDEIPYFPKTKFFPGVIGGHCVMPNIRLLNFIGSGPLFEAIKESNILKEAREASAEETGEEAPSRKAA
ncbi:MAG: hypothetical protein AAGA58_08450 [Verrucomicrobiota bacterium]